ncbi:MAG: DUF6048 family protein [Cyclobacteriaceae bacterium]
MAKLWLTISIWLIGGCVFAQSQTKVEVPADSLIIIFRGDSIQRQQLIDSIDFSLDEVIESKEDRKEQKALEDSLRKLDRSFLRDFGLYVDYGKFIGFIADFEQKNAVGARLTFGNNIYIGGEYGWGTVTPPDAYENTAYEVSGSYMRLMAGLMKSLTPKTNIGFGLAYATGTYEDIGTPMIESPSGLFEVEVEPFARENIKASWYELNLLSESQLARNLYLGLTIRLRVMGDYDRQEPLDIFTLPGYGRTFDNSLPAANLFIRYQFSL